MTDNVAERMFDWWNGAYARQDGFTPEAFARFFTEDAVLVVNGNLRGTGPAELARHFQRIKAGTEAVRLHLPLEDTFCTADRIFLHYRCSATAGGVDSMEACMGAAAVRDGKISQWKVIAYDL